MAKNTNQSAPNNQNTLLNVIVVAVIAVFVIVGAFATYGKIAGGIEEKAISEGRKEATVSYLAKQKDMTVEDFLAEYGLELSDTITKDMTESELLDNLTIENYLKYDGNSQTAEEVIEGTGLTDKVTKDTLWKDFLPQAPAVSVVGEESLNQIKTQLGLSDEELNNDTTYGELENIINSHTAATEDTAAEGTNTENTAEDAAATEAPAAE